MAPQPIALITGASSGIGEATAVALAAHGFTVFGTSRKPDRAARPPCTMLVAGRSQLDTNLFGVMRMIKAVLPGMRQRGGGRIINVSSVVGQFAPAYVGLYATSKFALEGLTEALRYEVRPFNIHVSLIEPGFVKTAIAGQAPANPLPEYARARQAAAEQTRAGLERGLAPAVVARVILKVSTTPRPRLRYPVGASARLLLALKRLLPEPVFERTIRRASAASQVSSAPQGERG